MLDAFKRVAAGEGREVFLVSGEAGLGKTTLVAEAARAAFDEGACVLFGHCEEDLATPYQLFTEALGHFVTHAPEEQLVAHVESWGSELARLVPALSSRLPGLGPSTATDADTERYQLFAAVVGLLVDGVAGAAGRAGARRPAVGGQGQPAAAASRRSPSTSRCGCWCSGPIATASCRAPTRCSRRSPALHRGGEVARIELAGLDDTGVVSLMEAAAGHALDDAAVRLAQAVHRETDGNPFFVSEVLRHLAETGAIYQDADRPVGRRGDARADGACPTASAW